MKPLVVISKCLQFDACRYNGQMISFDLIDRLKDHVLFKPVCPEVEIGLGIPRDPIRVVRVGTEFRLVQPTSGRDLTEAMSAFSAEYLTALSDADGFVLKSRSPSCGVKDVKTYRGPDNPNTTDEKTSGFFAAEVLRRFPHLAIEDEGRLMNFKLREHWLTKLFLMARWRHLKQKPTMKALVRFQADNKLLFMSYNQKEMRLMGRIVANHEDRQISEVIQDYQAHLGHALSRPARAASHINTLMHALGYVSDGLSAKERAFFLRSLDRFRDSKIPLSAVLTIMHGWAERFDQPNLLNQTYFEPFPEALVDVTDSGKGRVG